jgi:hypothetical protein
VSSRARLGVILVSVLTLTATLALRLGTDVSTAAVSSTMHASVGPGYVISLTFDDGTAALSLPAGSYRVLVEDQSNEHNFHLYGPGVDELTSVEAVSNTAWNLTFRQNSRYSFVCDPHVDQMYGGFNVGDPPPEGPSSGSGGGGGGGSGGGTGSKGSAPLPKATGRVLATLGARVDGRGKLALTLKGKPVKTLAQGSYRIVVVDGTKKDDFTLRRVGGPATPLTGAAFVGSRTVTTDLKQGQWKFYSSKREGASAGFFRVTKS